MTKRKLLITGIIFLGILGIICIVRAIRPSDPGEISQTSSSPIPSSSPNDSSESEIESEAVEITAFDREIERDMEALHNSEQALPDMQRLEAVVNDSPVERSVAKWQVLTYVPEHDPLPLHPAISEKEPIRLNSTEEKKTAVGDVIALPLPGALNYQAIVASVQISQTGETSWTGYLQGYAQQYPVVFTLGATSSFATITTPDGQYTMEAIGTDGWVYKVPDESTLGHNGRNDALVIER